MSDNALSYVHLSKVIVAVILISGMIPLPFGYYEFLRIFVTISSIAYGILYLVYGKYWSAVPFFLIALLYQPVFRIVLDKNAWHIIDFLLAIFFLLSFGLDFNGELKKEKQENDDWFDRIY